MPMLHLQYRGIEHLQNLKVRVLPALAGPLACPSAGPASSGLKALLSRRTSLA